MQEAIVGDRDEIVRNLFGRTLSCYFWFLN